MTAEAARLFVAVEVGADVRADAASLAAALADEAPRAAGALRWVRPDQMHLTLRFLGDVDAALLQKISIALREGRESTAFTMAVGGLEWIPSARRPRVLARAIVQGAERLLALQAEVDRRLARVLSVPRDDRPFRPHVTLARVREGRQGALRSLAIDDARFAPVRRVAIESATVYRSRLSPAGPSYTVVDTLGLGGRA